MRPCVAWLLMGAIPTNGNLDNWHEAATLVDYTGCGHQVPAGSVIPRQCPLNHLHVHTGGTYQFFEETGMATPHHHVQQLFMINCLPLPLILKRP